MNRQSIAAYTALDGSYPAYVSIVATVDGVEFHVRSTRGADGSCGASAVAAIDRDAAITVLREALAALGAGVA